MAKHIETRERKAARLGEVFNTIRKSSDKVKLNALYDHLGSDIWNTSAYFIQDVLKNIPVDITVSASKKLGTFAVCATAPTKVNVKTITMGGLFPTNWEGSATLMEPDKKWKAIIASKLPKAFKALGDTVKLFRLDTAGAASQYLQVTMSGNFLFQMCK